jgi:hypothetical protein
VCLTLSSFLIRRPTMTKQGSKTLSVIRSGHVRRTKGQRKASKYGSPYLCSRTTPTTLASTAAETEKVRWSNIVAVTMTQRERLYIYRHGRAFCKQPFGIRMAWSIEPADDEVTSGNTPKIWVHQAIWEKDGILDAKTPALLTDLSPRPPPPKVLRRSHLANTKCSLWHIIIQTESKNSRPHFQKLERARAS